MDRTSATARAGAFDAAAGSLQQGDLVGVAPEQTISRSFDLLPLRTGAARMAQLANAPIVPVIGWGSHRALTKGQPKRPALGIPVSVRFGEPIHPRSDEGPAQVTERLQERMAAMLDEVQRSYPDGTPPGAPWVPARLGGSAPAHDEVVGQEQERTRSWKRQGSSESSTHGEREERDTGT